MRRATIVFLGVLLFSVTETSVYAQSGTRSSSGGGSSSGGSSSGGSLAGGSSFSSGFGGGFGGFGGSYRPRQSPAELAAAVQARNNLLYSQAELNRQRANNEYQSARAAATEAHFVKQKQRMLYREQQQLNTVKLRERNLQEQEQRELERAIKMAKSTIRWPADLRTEKYEKHLAEIEALAKVYAEVGEKAGVKVGVKVGFRTSVRSLAQQIMKDEQAGIFTGSNSRQIRSFVRTLNSNYGQFPQAGPHKMQRTIQQKVDGKGLVLTNM